jgi:dCMP deaminase
LDRHPDATDVLLLGRSFEEHFPVLRKEIRALAPEVAAAYVRAARPKAMVRVVEHPDLPGALTGDCLVVPDEELMRDVLARFAPSPGTDVIWERTFLRWDRSWSLPGRPAGYDGVVGTDELTRSLVRRSLTEAGLSSDWWRQVGAVAARDGTILAVAHN